MKSQTSVARAANTTAYTAGDVVAGLFKLTDIASQEGAEILLTSVGLRLDISAVPSGMSSFRMHLFNDAPTAISDNSAFDVASGDRSKYLGYITIDTPVDAGATCQGQNNTANKHVKLAAGKRDLWAYLETTAGYTPAGNSENYALEAHSVAV